jgi:oxygen-dependent protoporphyrinogen oxidase
LVARVKTELASLCGVTGTPEYVEVNRWMKAMPQYTLGHLERLTQIEAALSRYPGLILTGAGYRGVGIPDCIRDGAIAAERVVRYLSGARA